MRTASSISDRDPLRRTSGPSGGPKGSASSSAAPATLSSALTKERLREGGRRSRYRGPGSYCGSRAESSRALIGQSPGRERYATASTGAPSFSSSVLLMFREWGVQCFSRRRGRDVGGGVGDSGGKGPGGGGGDGGRLPGPPRGTGSREAGAGGRSSPPKRPPLREKAQTEAEAALLERKPSRERVPAPVTSATGNPVARGGRKPSRESTSAPPNVIPEPWRDEKPSSRRPEAVAPVSGPAPPPAGEAPDAGGSVGRGPTATSSPAMLPTSGEGGKERAFVWADRYRPRALEDFICNRAMVAELLEMVSKGECDHFIFEGPPGVGKKTMISALLREVFGPEKSETRDEVKIFALKGEIVPNIEANVKKSSQHVEINLSELRGYERHVVVDLIKASPRSTSRNIIQRDHTNCQAIVLYEADKLSTDSQHYICWLMEKYKACSKMIFCCSDSSSLQPVKHLCKVVKLHPPSQNEIVQVLEYIAKNEGIDLPHNVARKIADNAKQNLRQAIRSFEACWHSSYPFKEDQEILTGWEEDIARIAKSIVEEQSPRQLYSIREKLKNLIEHNVSPHFIFSTLRQELKKRLDDNYHTKLDDICGEYKNEPWHIMDPGKTPRLLSQDVQENTDKGNDDMTSFMTIEEFTAKFMSFYKSNVVKKRGREEQLSLNLRQTV